MIPSSSQLETKIFIPSDHSPGCRDGLLGYPLVLAGGLKVFPLKGEGRLLALPTLLDYSIIIPAYNEEVLLPHTIDSIRDAMSYISGKTGEIIVVDNDSSDLTAEVAKAKKCRVVNESFRQIAKARNTGAKEAIGRYLFFVDADTVVPKKILQEAISKMEKITLVVEGHC